MIYGGLGIIIALGILALIPAGKQTQVTPYVTLDRIPGYGIQFIMASPEQAELDHVHVTISSVEVLATEGEWVEVYDTETSWDMLHLVEKTLRIDPGTIHASYLKARINIEPEPSKTNATLSDGQVLPLEVQTNPFEVDISGTVIGETSEFSLVFRIGSGKSSIHILPNYRVQVVTARLTGEITGK